MITSILVTAAVIYTVVAGAMYISQDRMLFLPNMPGRELTLTPAVIGLEYEDVTIRTVDGVTLHGWYVPQSGSERVLVFFHGNAGNISHRLDSVRIFNELDLNVLIIDYRGYGQSAGKPSEQGTYRDAEAVWKFTTGELGFKPEQIVIFGRSLGGSVGAWLGSQKQPGAIIVESAFTSVPDAAAELYPFLPVRLLARLNYNTLEYIRDSDSRILVIHSRDDEIIPFHHGQSLYEAASEPKSFLEIQGGHNDSFLMSYDTYVAGLKDFLNQHD
jgi:fermentation-respiration switch protein FrsA (DUF1100 family)